MIQPITIQSRIEIPNPELIHIGDNTHHHDQDIVPTSFSTIKTIVSRPTNPIPPLDELDEFDITFSFLRG